jgi:O-antigen/teichoic acid export membrane protein
MTASRTERFVGGLGLSYVNTALMTLVGLWLTPYLLRHLGQQEYGLWLLGAQALFYLGLMDFGVMALLPRDVAYATGRAGANQSSELARLVGETTRVVLYQTPAIAVGGLLFWWLIPDEWSALRSPLAIMIAGFALTYPLRIPQAVLQGLQDLPFLVGTQLAGWVVGTVLTVGCVYAGFGLYSLAAGWIAAQVFSAALAWRRYVRDFAFAVPARLPRLSMLTVFSHMRRGVWISVSQIAQVLVNGTDLFVIGKLLGPAAIVPYACTSKLITLLANQPQLFMQMALPALSELRTGASRERLFEVSSGMAQLMLLASGAIVCVVLAVNESFVTWWVGASRFGGQGLTMLLLAAMLLRHWNTTAVYALFCFGYERRLAITLVVDGLIMLVAMTVLVPLFGIKGAVFGSLLGTCTVSLPSNLRALAREEGVRLATSLSPLRRWTVRFGVVVAAVAIVRSMWTVNSGLWQFALVAVLVVTFYAVSMLPIVLSPPLGPSLSRYLRPWLLLVPGLSRRIAVN